MFDFFYISQALQCLFKGDYDVPRAVELIHAARRQTLRLKEEETERTHKNTFERAMDRHGKKFHLVKVGLIGCSDDSVVKLHA